MQQGVGMPTLSVKELNIKNSNIQDHPQPLHPASEVPLFSVVLVHGLLDGSELLPILEKTIIGLYGRYLYLGQAWEEVRDSHWKYW